MTLVDVVLRNFFDNIGLTTGIEEEEEGGPVIIAFKAGTHMTGLQIYKSLFTDDLTFSYKDMGETIKGYKLTSIKFEQGGTIVIMVVPSNYSPFKGVLKH